MAEEPDAIPLAALLCAQCGSAAEPRARRWKGYLDDDDAVVLFCTECATREFER